MDYKHAAQQVLDAIGQNGTVILSRVEQVMRHRTLAMHGLQLILGSR